MEAISQVGCFGLIFSCAGIGVEQGVGGFEQGVISPLGRG